MSVATAHVSSRPAVAEIRASCAVSDARRARARELDTPRARARIRPRQHAGISTRWSAGSFAASTIPNGRGSPAIKKFIKVLSARRWPGDGYNCPVVQNVLDGRWHARPLDHAPKRFGSIYRAPVDANRA